MPTATVIPTLAPEQRPTPSEIERYRAIAEALLAQSQDGQPVEHWTQGVANMVEALMGGINQRKANKLQREGEARGYKWLEENAGLLGGGGGYGGGAPSTGAGETSETPNMEAMSGTGDDADMIIRTVIGEAAGEDPVGQQAVASVILNRAKQAGMTPSQVVLAKGQFEPWGSRGGQLRAIDPSSEQYRRVAANVLPILQGQAPDPTGGATHFYSPTAQAALGRSTPEWARGQGQDIGRHRFYSLGYTGQGRHGLGGQPRGAAASGINPALDRVIQRAMRENPGAFGIPTAEAGAAAGLSPEEAAALAPGRRTPEQQQDMVARGWSKTTDSPHLGGGASDLWPINPATGRLDPNYTAGYDAIQAAMRKAAQAEGVPVEWGGDWQGFKDRPHWQLPKGYSGETADIPGAEPVSTAPSPDVMAHILGGATPAAAPRGWDDAQPMPYSVGGELPRAVQGPPPPAGAGTVPLPPVATPSVVEQLPPQFGRVGGPPPGGAGTVPMPPVTPTMRAPPPGGAGTVPLPPATPIMRAPPPGGAGTVPLPPVAAPAAAPLAARVPQPRPAPPVAPAAPATTGTVPATAPARAVYPSMVKNDYNAMPGRPPAAMPMKPGQLMQEPYSGPMSAQDFARLAPAALRARRAGQVPGAAPAAGAPAEPRRGLLQTLLGRSGTPGATGAPAAPTGAPVAPGRAGIAAALQDISFLPAPIQAAVVKRMFPEPGEGFTLGDTRFDAQGNIIASVPGKPEKPTIVSPGGTVLGPNNEVLYQAPFAPKEPEKRESYEDASGVRRYVDTQEPVFPSDLAGGGGGRPMFTEKSVEGQSLNYLVEQGVLTPQQAAEVGAGKSITGPNGETIFMTPSGLVVQPAGAEGAPAATGDAAGGKVITGPRVTEDQRKTAGFHSRMNASSKIITEMEQAALSDWNQGASQIPVIGNRLVSTEFQQFDQAQRDFINAQLRRESGAVISDAEFQNARKQYLPVPGDDPKTLKQKAEARRRAVGEMERSSAAMPVFAEPEGEAVEVDENGVPVDVDPNTWKYMTPEQQEEYLHG